MEILGYALLIGIFTRITDIDIGVCLSGCGV